MYNSTKKDLKMLQLDIQGESLIKNDIEDLKRRKDLMEGITPVDTEEFNPNIHRSEIMRILKYVTIKPTEAYVYLYDTHTLQEFYMASSEFIKYLKNRRNLNIEDFKIYWELYYKTLLENAKKLPLKNVDIDTQKEYDAIYERLVAEPQQRKELEAQEGIDWYYLMSMEERQRLPIQAIERLKKEEERERANIMSEGSKKLKHGIYSQMGKERSKLLKKKRYELETLDLPDIKS